MRMKLPVPTNRFSEYPIDRQFLKRYSPRAMTGAEMPMEELLTLFEAARWAPSSSNSQPWRFLFARRNTPEWETFFDLLDHGNKIWTHKASALALSVSRTVSERSGKPNATHAHDTGAAWMSLALQGSHMGLVVHGMGGFDRARAMSELNVPAEYAPQAMMAIGYYGNPEDLPEEKKAGETPSMRKPLREIVIEGKWPEGKI
jgi:nitroreductase